MLVKVWGSSGWNPLANYKHKNTEFSQIFHWFVEHIFAGRRLVVNASLNRKREFCISKCFAFFEQWAAKWWNVNYMIITTNQEMRLIYKTSQRSFLFFRTQFLNGHLKLLKCFSFAIWRRALDYVPESKKVGQAKILYKKILTTWLSLYVHQERFIYHLMSKKERLAST